MHSDLAGVLARGRYSGIKHVKLTLRTSNDLAGIGRNVYACDRLVMPSEFILQFVSAAALLEQVDAVVASYGEGLAVGGEGMVCDGVVEEMVDFRASHCDGLENAIGDSLLLRGIEYCTLVRLV